MVSFLSISGLSYSENPRNTRNQCEESRKVWGQYIHEHGNVIQNICKKSEEEREKLKKNTSNWTNSLKHVAAPSCTPPLFSLRVEFCPGNEDKNLISWTLCKTFFCNFFKQYIYPFLHAKRILPHMPVPSAGQKPHFTHPPRHTSTASIEIICWRLTF